MADDFIELVMEGVDHASDPNRSIHKKRRQGREARQQQQQGAEQRRREFPERPPTPVTDDTSDVEEVPRDAEFNRQYADHQKWRPRDASRYAPGSGAKTRDSRRDRGDVGGGAQGAFVPYGVYYGAPEQEVRYNQPYGERFDSEYRRDIDGSARARDRSVDRSGNSGGEVDGFRRRRDGGTRPAYRSRSSHQGDQSVGFYDYPRTGRNSERHAHGERRDERGRSGKSRRGHSRGSDGYASDGRESKSERGGRSRDGRDSPTGVSDYLSSSKVGLGASAVGALAGGWLAWRSGEKKKKSGNPLIRSVLGAVAGGVGANAVGKYVEDGKERGTVKDSWGQGVGGTRKKIKEKVGMAEPDQGRHEDRDESRDRRRHRTTDRDRGRGGDDDKYSRRSSRYDDD